MNVSWKSASALRGKTQFRLIFKEGSAAERFKALTRNPEVPSSSPPPACLVRFLKLMKVVVMMMVMMKTIG